MGQKNEDGGHDIGEGDELMVTLQVTKKKKKLVVCTWCGIVLPSVCIHHYHVPFLNSTYGEGVSSVRN